MYRNRINEKTGKISPIRCKENQEILFTIIKGHFTVKKAIYENKIETLKGIIKEKYSYITSPTLYKVIDNNNNEYTIYNYQIMKKI
jgi:hypothetical protein